MTVPHPPHGAASAQRWELLDLPHPSFISRAGAADLGTKIADVIRTTRDAAVSHAHDQRSVPSVLPVSLAKGWVSSEFGMRIHPISGKRRMHAGIDLAVDEGTPVIATADGTVLFAQRNGGYGFLLKIDHRNGIQTWYAHNCRLLVKAGQPVARGDRIALSGETGYTTGEHLHYEVRVDGKPVEPRLFLPRVIVEGGKRTASRVGDSSRH